MKATLLLALSILTLNYAEACIGEAQIIAETQGVQPVDLKTCLVSINPYSVRFYSENRTCPLDLSEVLNSGIKVSTKSDGVCSVHPGDAISGVVVVNQDGSLSLE